MEADFAARVESEFRKIVDSVSQIAGRPGGAVKGEQWQRR